jgi:hypothetical protein
MTGMTTPRRGVVQPAYAHARIRGLALNTDMLSLGGCGGGGGEGAGSPRALIPGAPAALPRARRSARGLEGFGGIVAT